ncbi:MAG TPA: YceD family protein [Burkholderiales bacterium]|nr:YceD family protein [Burkholderiales bacterium]
MIDGYEFAASRARLSGVWPIEDFARLRPLLASDAGALEYSLEGLPDAQDRPALHLRIWGALELGCQRCLAPLEFPLRIHAVLVLARSQADIDALPIEAEGPDWVLATKAMEVHELLEDELLLAVPYAPRHEQCAAQGRTGASTSALPFASLRGMLATGETQARGKRS